MRSAPAPPGTLAFASPTATVNESAGTLTLQVVRTGGSNGAVSVAYSTTNGTATAGSDFSATSGTLTWGSGETAAKTITVTILNDAVNEPAESFTVTLSSPTGGAALGSAAVATVTINDDDPASVAGGGSGGSGGSSSAAGGGGGGGGGSLGALSLLALLALVMRALATKRRRSVGNPSARATARTTGGTRAFLRLNATSFPAWQLSQRTRSGVVYPPPQVPEGRTAR